MRLTLKNEIYVKKNTIDMIQAKVLQPKNNKTMTLSNNFYTYI